MKRFFVYALIACAGLVSCKKEISSELNPEMTGDPEKEIVIGCDGEFKLDFGVDTKATAVTSLPSSLYWGGTTGTRGNAAEAQKWTAASGTVSSSKISTGKYQTATATAYNYYVANQTFTVPATGNVTMTASNANDVICGWAPASTSTTPSVTLNHIFARTGTLAVSAPSGYTATLNSCTIVGKSTINGTAGTYNLSTGAWTAASTKLSSATALTGSSDMYLIPGTYTLAVTYTLTRGDFTKQYTQSADVTLVGGKQNNITANITITPAVQIVLSLSLTAWSANNITVNLPNA